MTLRDRMKLIYLRSIYGYRSLVLSWLGRLLFRPYQAPSKIVIHRVAAFGDAIVSLPAIAAIRKQFPHTHIDLVSTAVEGITLDDVLQGSPVVNRVLLFKKQERGEALRQIRDGEYDLYIELPQNLNLYKSIRNMLLVRFYPKIPSAFGWDRGRLKRFAAIQVAHMQIPTEIERFRRVLSANGIEGEVEFPIVVGADDRQAVDALLQTTGDRLRVGFLIGGKLEQKKWPLDNWVSLAERLEGQFSLCVIGGPDEQAEAGYISSRVPSVTDLCGKTSILQTAELLRRCDAVVALDTGAMHLAYAVGTPVVALFSTRDITAKWRPYGEQNIAIEKQVPCSYCFSRHCDDNICMQQISVDEVHRALGQLMPGQPVEKVS